MRRLQPLSVRALFTNKVKTINQKQCLLRGTAIPAGPTTLYPLPNTKRNHTSLTIHVIQKITIIRAQKIGKSAV